MIKRNFSSQIVIYSLIMSVFMCCKAIGQDVQSDSIWKFEKKSSDVELYSQKTRSGFLKVKATTELPIEADLFLALLENVDIADNWIANCEKVEVINSPSDNERIVHTYFSAPWPVRDRDMVTYSKTSFDEMTNTITIRVRDYSSKLPGVENYVRMKNVNGVWTIKNSDENNISITYEGFGEPAGNIPIWMANNLLKSSTFETFKNMRAILKKQQYEKSLIEPLAN